MSTARNYAANYIVAVGDRMKTASGSTRLLPVAKAFVHWTANEFQTKAPELADANRTASNVMTASAAVLAQRNALIASRALEKASPPLTGPVARASTDQVIPAQRPYKEGFGGLYHDAMLTFALASDNPSDLAQALIPLTTLHPLQIRKVAAASPNVDSIQKELRLCEALCAYVRRIALAQSIIAGVRVAPSRQPDASLTRGRLLRDLDLELTLASQRPDLYAAIRRTKTAVTNFTGWFSQGGGGSVPVPYASAGAPLANVAADMYGRTGTKDMDASLMQFNGVDHPLFGPGQMDALVSRD